MPFGADVQSQGTRFRLWAPKHNALTLKIDGHDKPYAMLNVGGGWHEYEATSAGPGTRYRFVLPDGTAVPDPASRFQPDDVHGPSEVVDPTSFGWSDTEWRGRKWEEMVIYEMHVGAFTKDGTFLAAIERLEYLRTLGITAIELMPVADFPGKRNWGYDGVLLFAPDSTYGKPDDLKALIAAAHQCGIAVLLDVVYNHFGPDGNYLPLYCPIFTDRHHTPWGAAINYDAEQSDVVRRLIVENAAYWISEFSLDGLRLDAVHAIIDDSPRHILEEIAQAAREAAGNRHVHLILENEENQASRLLRDETGIPSQFTAQWNDDVHHVLHTAASGERSGYYGDYIGDTEKLGRALAEGFAFQGELMPHRGHPRGESSASLPATAFVSFIQNHDQVGNSDSDPFFFGQKISRRLLEWDMSLSPATAVSTTSSERKDVGYNSIPTQAAQTTMHLHAAAGKDLSCGKLCGGVMLANETAVSANVAQAMARGAVIKTGASLAVAITGVTGSVPDEDGNPVGLVYCGVARASGGTKARRLDLDRGEPGQLTQKACESALELLREFAFS